MENPKFLHKKYPDLNTSPEVESSAKRFQQRKGETLPPQNPEARIQNYLDRLKNIVNPSTLDGHEGFDRKQRNLEMLKHSLYDQFIIKPDDIPEAYFESVKKKHEEEGRPLDEIPGEIRKELAETIVTDQKNSLDEWVDYLTGDGIKYPDYLRYLAFRSILRMGRYDKKKKSFAERTGGAIAPFPDLNREALVIVLESFELQAKGEQPKFGYDIGEEIKQKFFQFLAQKNFVKLYALAIEEFKPIPEKLLEVTKGAWVKYPKGSDAANLVQSIAPYGTGWCLRGESMARRYLSGNDLEIFYSLDKEMRPTVPRVVIVSSGGIISEVRGVAEDEHIDPHINDVVKEKLAILPDGKKYEKKALDMKLLTQIKSKSEAGQELTRDDLAFLYEIDSTIESFGYGTNDPRVKEIRAQRNPEEDMLVIFECTKDQIARNTSEITEHTKAYLGNLELGIFDLIRRYNIEHVYTSFPEGKIRRQNLEIGGKTAKQIEAELKKNSINVSGYAQDMLRSKDFTTLKSEEQIELVRLKISDLGFKNGATTDEIYRKAEELDLELCPAEVGPNYRLKYMHQPLNEWLWIAMKQITDRYGDSYVFRLGHDEDGLWLRDSWAYSGHGWGPGYKLVFRLRKFKS